MSNLKDLEEQIHLMLKPKWPQMWIGDNLNPSCMSARFYRDQFESLFSGITSDLSKEFWKGKEDFIICDKCQGDKFTSEHAFHPHLDGDCCGECPIQVPCEYCHETGFLTGSMLLEKEKQRRRNIIIESQINYDDLPF